jgi:hypothetical protein
MSHFCRPESEQRPDARAAAEPAERHRNENGTEHC